MEDEEVEFRAFVVAAEPRLRRALVALCGPDAAADALTDGFVHAWKHWRRVRSMTNPVGYVYVVARSRIPRRRRRFVVHVGGPPSEMPHIEPRLSKTMAALPERQRVCVFLVHGCDMTVPEVAQLLQLSTSTVRNHAERGLAKLRASLGATIDG